MVCLQAHPLVAPRPALLETLPRQARLTATVELGECLAAGRSGPSRTQVLPDLASYTAQAREAWRDVVAEGLAALVAGGTAAPATRRAGPQAITRGRSAVPEGSLWQAWRRELRRWVQGLPSGAPETAES